MVGAKCSAHVHFMDMRVDEAFACQGAQFHDVNFDRAQFSKGAFLSFGEAGQQTRFVGTVRFHSSLIKTALIADGVIFENDLVFDATSVEGQAFFKRAVFSGDTRFTNAIVSGNAEFHGSQFKKDAKFDRAQIRGGASFRIDDNGAPTRFEGEASFQGARFGSQALFTGAEFLGPTRFVGTQFSDLALFDGATFHQQTNFDRAQFQTDATFQPDSQGKPTRFRTKVFFVSCKVGGSVVFDGAQFEGPVRFDGIEISQLAAFRPDHNNQPVRFHEDCSFIGTHFYQQAIFDDTIFAKQAQFAHARFEREVGFNGVVFGDSVTFDSADFLGSVFFRASSSRPVMAHGEFEFRDASVKDVAYFSSAQFTSEAHFDRTQFGRGLSCDGIVCKDEATFVSTYITGQAAFQGSVFRGRASFNRMVVTESAFFRAEPDIGLSAATFEDEANFVGAEIGSQAGFQEVRFTNPSKVAAFDSLRVHGSASFQGARFSGDARFLNMSVGGQIQMMGAVFQRDVDFDAAKIGGRALFRSEPSIPQGPTVFGGRANFRDVDFGSSAEFKDVVFSGGVVFQSSRFRGNAIFHSTQFAVGSKPSFRGARFFAGAFFHGAKFEDSVEFITCNFEGEAQLNGALFVRNASFAFSVFRDEVDFASGSGLGPAVFELRTSFEHTRFERHVDFSDTVFNGDVVLNESYLGTAFFSENGRLGHREQFQGALDLIGCTYERIRVHWRLFLTRGDGSSRLSRYDQQPYDQLEKMFRAAGDERTAEEVYLERRRAARQNLANTHKWSWFRDWLYWQTLNYGVRPYHLGVYVVIALALGTWAFQAPNAVRESSKNSSGSVVLKQQSSVPPTQKQLGLWDAGRLSLRFFLPVSIPLETDIEPTTNRWCFIKFSDLAALLSIMGWIIVPVGIAATTGLLRRVAK